MDQNNSEARLNALKNIKKAAEEMAIDGVDSFEIRQFINDEKQKVSFDFPEHGEYSKAKKTVEEYRRQLGTDPINDIG